MGDGTANSVIAYLDNLVDRGKASAGAIGPLKIAFTKVMQTVDGKSWRDTDVRSVDLDDYMDRFANLTMGKYSTYSLGAYKTRAGKALAWYQQFLDTPGWAPSIQRRKPAERTPKSPPDVTAKPSKAQTSPPATAALAQLAAGPQPPTDTPSAPGSDTAGRVLYPYPLSDGQLIHISLPLKLTKSDAKRIGAFIESIAITE